MTRESATRLLRKFSEAYLFPYAKKLTEMDSARWVRFIATWDVSEKQGESILTAFVGKFPPKVKDDGTPTGSMPLLHDVSEFYEDTVRPRTMGVRNCPCCKNTRWVLTQQKITNLDNGESRIIEYQTICDCIDRPEAEDFFRKMNGGHVHLRGYDWLREHPRAKCTSMQCEPTRTAPCPMGGQHHNQMKLAFRRNITADPAHKKGLSMSKYNNDAVEAVDAVTEAIDDIPGLGYDDLPF